MNEVRTVEAEELDVLPNGYPTENTDFPTTVQVTLAKRVLRSGSNKVLCMAAQTSVPLHEDDLASQSDVGLRLPDGTSVRLSLSSFNDQTAATFGGGRTNQSASYRAQPAEYKAIGQDRVYNPARYEPDRFRVKGMSGVTAAFIVLSLAGAVTVSVVSFTKPSSKKLSNHAVARKQPRPLVATGVTPAVPQRALAKIPVGQLTKTEESPATRNKPAAPDASKQKLKAPVRSQSDQYSQQSKRKAPTASTENQRDSGRPAARKGAGAFFIPPPPPVVPLMAYPPYGMTPPQFQIPVTPTDSQPPARQTRAAKRSESPSLDLPAVLPIQTNGRFGAPFQEAPAKVSPAESSRNGQTAVKSLHPQELPAAQAPLPGAQPQLERIVWPEQAQ